MALPMTRAGHRSTHPVIDIGPNRTVHCSLDITTPVPEARCRLGPRFTAKPAQRRKARNGGRVFAGRALVEMDSAPHTFCRSECGPGTKAKASDAGEGKRRRKWRGRSREGATILWHGASGHDSESEPGGEAKDDSMKRTKSGSRALLVWFQTACGNGSEKKVRASAEMLP